jgi:hypothetical protein
MEELQFLKLNAMAILSCLLYNISFVPKKHIDQLFFCTLGEQIFLLTPKLSWFLSKLLICIHVQQMFTSVAQLCFIIWLKSTKIIVWNYFTCRILYIQVLQCLLLFVLTVYLRTAPEICMERIQKRQRSEESTVSMVSKLFFYIYFKSYTPWGIQTLLAN